jgi:glycosyltransferase involved in cell wall biosynthesis
MYRGKSVAVVVPAYNEEGFVGEVVRTLPSFVDCAYVVDDASTDGTWSEIQRVAARQNSRRRLDGVERPRVVTIRHETNRGVGAAIKSGYRRVRREGFDVAAVMNGDGQMDPAILDRILDPVAGDQADYAKGNRLLDGTHFGEMSTVRLIGNFLLTYLTKIASGYWKTMDPQNGYTAISSRALAALDLDELYDGYGFCNDILIHLNARGMRVADVSMEAVYGEESSSIRYRSFVPRVSTLLFTGFLWRLRERYLLYDFHPLVALYAVGAFGTGASLLAAFTLVLFTSTPLTGLLLSITLFVLSIAVLTLGASFDLSNTVDQELRVHHSATPAPITDSTVSVPRNSDGADPDATPMTLPTRTTSTLTDSRNQTEMTRDSAEPGESDEPMTSGQSE